MFFLSPFYPFDTPLGMMMMMMMMMMTDAPACPSAGLIAR